MLNELLNHQNCKIIDVRTPFEFSEGCVEGSINIPLDEVPNKIAEFKQYSGPIVLCCRSGARSETATRFLKANGFDNVHNGGSWTIVKSQLIK